ncbi:hypothetical protein PSYAC_29211, partial [Pseudomonas syringae pv. actinidiae str. M302091]
RYFQFEAFSMYSALGGRTSWRNARYLASIPYWESGREACGDVVAV